MASAPPEPPRPAERAPHQQALTRRRWLEVVVGATALAAGGLGLVRRGSVDAAPRDLRSLGAWQWRVVQAAAARIVAPDVAVGGAERTDMGGAPPTAEQVGVATFVDRWLSSARPRDARDFRRFLAFLEHVAPLGSGYLTRFSRLGAIDQDRVLGALQQSHSDLLRAGFDGLRSLVFMGYYRDPRTWSISVTTGRSSADPRGAGR